MVDAGALVRQCRRRAGLAQRELAARAGLSVRALRDIEQGRVRRPRMGSVHRLVDALSLTGLERVALLDAFGEAGTHRPEGAGGAVRIDVLGPLVLRRGAATLHIGQAMPRTLLCLLALHAGEPVPVRTVAAFGNASCCSRLDDGRLYGPCGQPD